MKIRTYINFLILSIFITTCFAQQYQTEGWVRIGYDYDQDNQIDAYEYIHTIDLQTAREKSQQRAREQRMTTKQAGQQFERQRKSRQISGTIQDIKSFIVAQTGKSHLIAKVRTQNNQPIVVDLGTENQIERLDLQSGDHIQFTAKKATLNQRQIYVASTVKYQGQTVNIDRQQGQNQTRLTGEIIDTKTKALSGRKSNQHVIALVKLDSGQKVPVDFGPSQDLQQLNIKSGKQVSILAEPAKIGDKKILVANMASIDGQRVNIDWMKSFKQ